MPLFFSPLRPPPSPTPKLTHPAFAPSTSTRYAFQYLSQHISRKHPEVRQDEVDEAHDEMDEASAKASWRRRRQQMQEEEEEEIRRFKSERAKRMGALERQWDGDAQKVRS